MATSSSSPICVRLLQLVVVVLLILPSASSSDKQLVYHGGTLLSGTVNLGLIWYGKFGNIHKSVMRGFIKSLNRNYNQNLQPPVSEWWKIVESYQAAANPQAGKDQKIRVRVVKQVTDVNYSVGKVITKDFLPGLASKVTNGKSDTVPVIFTSRDVTVQGLCMGKCGDHGLLDIGSSKVPYIVVGNPATECPGACAWPFHKPDSGPQGVTLQPPNGNVGADAMVISFAQSLAALVTNPHDDGFNNGLRNDRIEASTACLGIFASGAFPGYTGKVRVNPTNGGAFNAYGAKGKKFLLPALWNPKTSSCWTTM